MKCLSIIILFILHVELFSQQHHTFSQFSLNRFALNPAVAGIKSCNTLNFGIKRQWVGFEGAPILNFASFYSRINKTNRTPKRVHGIGFYVAHESEGVVNKTYAKIAYAYHFKLWKNYNTSIGLFAGFQQAKYGKFQLRTLSGQIDPAFEDKNGPDYVFPEISPSVYVESRKLFGGISLFQVFPAKFKKLGTGRTNIEPHLFIMGGYHFRNRSFTYTPSFFLSMVFFHSPTLDLSFMANYKNKFSLGVGSKYVNSAYLTFDMRIFNWATVGYVYEYSLSPLNSISSNTHEIIVSLSGCNKYIDPPQFYCPVYD